MCIRDSLFALEAALLEDAFDRVRNRSRVDNGAVDDRIGRHRLNAKCGHTVVLVGRLQLDGLYCAGANVQSDNALLLLAKHRLPRSPREGVSHPPLSVVLIRYITDRLRWSATPGKRRTWGCPVLLTIPTTLRIIGAVSYTHLRAHET